MTHDLHRLLDIAARQVSFLVARRFEDTCGLTELQWRILAAISTAGVASPGAIGDTLAIGKVLISRTLTTLTDRRLIERLENPRDGRSALLRVTKQGAKLVERGMAAIPSLEADLAAMMSRQEWSVLHRALVKLRGDVG